MVVAQTDGASSISVTVRVRPFTIREAAQLTKSDDGPLFLGDGSLAAVPAPKLGQKGIRPVIKVMDEKCLCALFLPIHSVDTDGQAGFSILRKTPQSSAFPGRSSLQERE